MWVEFYGGAQTVLVRSDEIALVEVCAARGSRGARAVLTLKSGRTVEVSESLEAVKRKLNA